MLRCMLITLLMLLPLVRPEAEAAGPGPDAPVSESGREKEGEQAPGFYYAVQFKAAQFGGGWGGFFGQRAAVVIKRTIALGAGCDLSIYADRGRIDAGGSLTGIYLQYPYPPCAKPRILYGGAYFAYHFFTETIASFSVGALIGGGHLGRQYAIGAGSDYFLIEPEAYAYVSLPGYVRFGAGLSYRVSWGISYQGITDMDFRGLSIGVQVQAGLL